MDINKLKSDIVNKTPENFYIFTGPEWKIQQIYLEKMEKSFGKPRKYIDSISTIYSKLSNKSFISQSYIYIVRDDSDLLNNESLQESLYKILSDNILVLLLTNMDKRTKFFKKYEEKICIFEHLTPDILKKYINKSINLNYENCNKLMEICEYDYGRCLLEIDKINHYTEHRNPDVRFLTLLKEGFIYQPPKDAIFEFVDAILDFGHNVYDLYEQCKAVNESTMVFLSVLYNNTKATLQVQAYNGKDIGKGTGLNYFQIQNAQKHVGKRRNSDLISIMKLCQECQEGIVTGNMEEEYVMDYILGEVLS